MKRFTIISRVVMIYCMLQSLLCFSSFQDHTQEQAHVRQGTALCQEEQLFLAARTVKVKHALETLLSMPIDETRMPRIALCGSGGGYRAMLATLGLYKAATKSTHRMPHTFDVTKNSISQKILSFLYYYYAYLFGSAQNSLIDMPLPTLSDGASLFDCCTYCSALSGSSWALAGWLQSRTPIDDYIAHIQERIQQHLFTHFDSDELAITLSKKYEFAQPVTFTDIYGSLLAQTFLSNLGVENPNDFYVGSDKEYMANARIPLPLHCALIGQDTPQYAWVEFSPFEVGSTFLNAFIPTYAFGRSFSQGNSEDFAPAASLGYCMGIWGSGMCLDLQEFLELVQPHLTAYAQTSGTTTQEIVATLNNEISLLLAMYGDEHKKNVLTDYRFFSPAQVHNWTHKLITSPLNECKKLTIVDAGIDFRVALPPILRPERALDIIIVLDASDRALGTELHEAQAYAQLHGLKFPPIDYTKMGIPFSVHQDQTNTSAPVIIYLPLVKNDGYENGWDPRAADFTSTYNFAYTQEQSELLVGLTEFTLEQSMPEIMETIKNWMVTRQAQDFTTVRPELVEGSGLLRSKS